MQNRLLRSLVIFGLLLSLCFCLAAEAAPPLPQIEVEAPQPSLPPVPEPPADGGLVAAEVSGDYTIRWDGMITAYSGSASELEIPAEIDGVKVTGIGYGAFEYNTVLTRVTVPEGVKKLESVAFRGCTSLSSITLPESLTAIGDWTFRECTALTNIDIPDGVTVIGSSAFTDCTALTGVSLPESLTALADWTFSGCPGLKQLVIPPGVKSIGYCTFYNCSALSQISVPAGLTDIGSWAFAECPSLERIDLPSGLKSIGDSAFYRCIGLTSLWIPDGVAVLGDWFAAYCDSLTSVHIPASAGSIGEYAFINCELLTELELPEGLEAIASNAFKGCAGLKDIALPSTLKRIEEAAFSGCPLVERLELPDGIEALGAGSLPSRAVLVFGTNSVIEQYALENGMQYVCDGKDATGGEFSTAAEKVAWVVDSYITPGMSEYEKALRLYNWLCANVAYDYQWLETGVATSPYGVTADGALLGGWAVCEGYAKAYVQLLDAVNMESRYVVGYAGDGSHAWNLVRINGKWYQFDPTWDEAGDGAMHHYFALSDSAMRSNHTQRDYKSIACNSYELNYEYRSGAYDDVLEALRSEIDAAALQGTYSGSFDVSGVSLPSCFWSCPAPYTVAGILGSATDWSLPGWAELTPEYPCFRYTFHPDVTAVTELSVTGLEKPADADRCMMTPGETVRLTVSTTPAGAPVSFASSSTGVVTVSSDGLITAVSEGTATVTVTSGTLRCELDISVSARRLVFGQSLYTGSPGERINPDLFLTGDPDGVYRSEHDYVFIEVFGGDAVEYIGYYSAAWDSGRSSWNFPFAADLMSPGAVTLVAELLDGSGVTTHCRMIVYGSSPLTLPESLRELRQESFMGLTAEEIIIPEGVETIGKRAFADCRNLELIHLPASVTSIADDAFEGCNNVTLLCGQDTCAQQYAARIGLDYIVID